MAILLYPKQAQIVASRKHKVGFIAGRGAGKSQASAVRLLVESCRTPDLYGLYAPTYPILRDTTLRTLIEVAQPWIAAYAESRGVIRMRSGSEIICRSLDDPEHARGPNLRGACIDEGGIVSRDAFLILRGCLRAHGELGWLCVTTTPKGKAHWTYEVFGPEHDADTEVVFARTEENIFNSPDFAPGLRAAYPTAFARQEVDGEFISFEGKALKRHWFRIISAAPKQLRTVCRYWDMAATPPDEKKAHDPDWTAGAKLARTPDGQWVLLDMIHQRLSPRDNEKLVAQTAALDGRGCAIRMEEEGGSSGKQNIDHYARMILPGYDFAGDRPTGDKVARAMPLAAAAEQGNVLLLAGPWNETFLSEAEDFGYDCRHDDQIDAAVGAFNFLSDRLGSQPQIA